jgi:hypothetical protein
VSDDAGHGAAKRWGGMLDAIFPQNLSVNRGVYRQMEHWVAETAAGGKEVHVLIEPLYDSVTAGRAFAIDFMVRVDGKSFLIQFANPL